MKTGTIKKVMDQGFGFIGIEGESKDLFFHSNELQNVSFDDLKEGDAVEFDTENGPKGLSAVNVSKV
jgi:CspA family cold shock protein